MVDITLIELDLEEGSFTANLPFSDVTQGSAEEPDEQEQAAATEEDDSGGKKGPAILGVFLLFVLIAAAVKYLSDGEEPDVEIETADDGPVGVTVDTE